MSLLESVLFHVVVILMLDDFSVRLHSQAQSPVYALSQHEQLITSSTLQWVTSENGHRPADAVPGGQNGTAKLHVCRAALKGGGTFHAGQLTARGGCKIMIGDQVLTYQRYQVLVNTDGAARLEWVGWRQFRPLPAGLVSVERDVYVARTWTSLDPVLSFSQIDHGALDEPIAPTKNRGYRLKVYDQRRLKRSSIELTPRQLTLGGLYMSEQYGLILVPGGPPNQRRQTAGQVLIEHEPKSFELTDFKRGEMRSEERSEVDLEDKKIEMKAELEAPDPSVPDHLPTHEFGQVFNLPFPRRTYFGKGHSIPTGSPVKVDFRNQTRLDLKWGVEAEYEENKQFRIAYKVPYGHKIQATLSATKIRQKFEYEATLLTYFEDGAILMRPIRGVYQVTYYDQLRPIYGQPEPMHAAQVKKKAPAKIFSAPEEIRYLFTTSRPSRSSGGDTTKSSLPSMVKSYRYPIKDSERDEKQRKDSEDNKNANNQAEPETSSAGILISRRDFSPLWIVLILLCSQRGMMI